MVTYHAGLGLWVCPIQTRPSKNSFGVKVTVYGERGMFSLEFELRLKRLA